MKKLELEQNEELKQSVRIRWSLGLPLHFHHQDQSSQSDPNLQDVVPKPNQLPGLRLGAINQVQDQDLDLPDLNQDLLDLLLLRDLLNLL